MVFGTTIDYKPKGWQAEIEGLTVRSDGASVLTLEGTAGRLAGAGEPLKTTAKLTALLAQPLARGVASLAAGDFAMTLAASLGASQKVHARLEVGNLETRVADKVVKLPSLAADVRADVGADGKIVFSAPFAIELGERKSDLAVSGSLVPGKRPPGTITATIASNRLVIDDARALAAIDSEAGEPGPGEVGAATPQSPPWAGLDGTVTLQLRQVESGDTFRASNVSGRIVLEAGKVRLEEVQAGLGESGRANLSGLLTYEAARPQPYALAADVALRDFDPGPLFQAVSRGAPAIM